MSPTGLGLPEGRLLYVEAQEPCVGRSKGHSGVGSLVAAGGLRCQVLMSADSESPLGISHRTRTTFRLYKGGKLSFRVGSGL